MNIAGRDRKFV